MHSPGTRESIRERIARHDGWYHKIDLHGVVTPGLGLDAIWDLIREVRSGLGYDGRTVLDLGSFDGMWAFEAEQLGAAFVAATDCYGQTVLDRLLLCREILGSAVVPYFNVSPYALTERLDVELNAASFTGRGIRGFDIIQNLGLMYHVRDPLMVLSQCRSVIAPGGMMIVETAANIESTESVMFFNNNGAAEFAFHQDMSTWWAPSIPCLKEMLRASLFEVEESSVRRLELPAARSGLGRVCLLARAVAPSEAKAELVSELQRTFRNPGLDTRVFLS